MKAEPRSGLSSRLKLCSQGASWVVILFGGLGLAGWVFGIEVLKSVFPGLPPMVPNTAAGFVLAGVSLGLQQTEAARTATRRTAQICALAITLIGSLTLCEYLFNWDAGIDRLLIAETASKVQTPIPGRPSFLTALNFLLVGLALMLLDTKLRRNDRPAELLSAAAILIALLALIGYACNVPSFYGWRSLFPGTGMALHTLTAFTVLGAGLLCARPDRGLMEIVTSPTASGVLARRLLLAPVAIPLLTGWLKLAGQRTGVYNGEFAGWLFAFLNLLIFTVAIWWSARLLYRAEMVRRRAEEDVHKLNVELEQRVKERTAEFSQAMTALQESEERVRLVLDTALDAVITIDDQGVVTSWNREAERTFGWFRPEILGRKLSDTIIPHRYRDAHERGLQHHLAAQEGPVLNKRIEITALHREGREFPVELAITPIRLGDRFMFSAFVRDITERKRAEEAHRVNEQRFRTLVEQSLVGIYVIQDGRFVYLNPKMSEIFGLSAEELGARPVFELVAPEDRDLVKANIEKREQGLLPSIRYSIRILHGDGETHFVEVHGGRVQFGDKAAVMGTMLDITDRKRAEDQLKTSHKEVTDLKTALDEHAIVAITDPQGKITYVNDKFCSISKYSRDELLGQDHRIINSGHHTKEFIRDLWTTIAHGQVWHGEIKNKAKDGTFYWVDTTIVPFLNEEGKPRQYVAIRADITERKVAEEALEASVKEVIDLKTALDEHAIVAITDSQGKITFVNDKFCAISKYSRAELLGQDHRIINSGHHAKEFIRDLWTTIAHGQVWHGEIKNQAKDGTFYWVDTTIVPFLNEQGKPRQYVAIRADITERKRAEEELREAKEGLEQKVAERTLELRSAKERAESGDRMKSEFLANMSHELRTPLNGIIGFSEFLVDEKPGQLNPKQKEYLGDVLNSARHLLQLINDVLDLAKIEAGRTDFSPETFPLREAVEEVCAVARPLAQKKNIAVSLKVAPELNGVTLDQQKFKQVLYNLLSNAIKFTQTGGTVEILTTVRDVDRFALQVKDTGIGIRPEDMDRLFRAFEQLETGANRQYEGTGLGLALTKKLVEMHGGEISVESIFGQGSTFTAVFPTLFKSKAE